MSDVSCPKCGGSLKLDFDKSRKESFTIYSCNCGVYGYFKVMDIEAGKKTKRKLADKKLISDLPF